MRKDGIVILVVGLLITAITGYSYITKEKIVEIDDLEITANKHNRANWSPLAGIAVIVVGGIMFVAGRGRN